MNINLYSCERVIKQNPSLPNMMTETYHLYQKHQKYKNFLLSSRPCAWQIHFERENLCQFLVSLLYWINFHTGTYPVEKPTINKAVGVIYVMHLGTSKTQEPTGFCRNNTHITNFKLELQKLGIKDKYFWGNWLQTCLLVKDITHLCVYLKNILFNILSYPSNQEKDTTQKKCSIFSSSFLCYILVAQTNS